MTAPAESSELVVVDDNPATRYSTSRVLRAAGFRVREAATGEEGLQATDADVAGVVLDVHLPDISGFEVCRALRERPVTSRVPIVHLSAAYVEDKDKLTGLHAGADAYMTHPVDPPLLVATLQALIRARTAEEGMRRSENRFRAIYERASNGIGLVDTLGRFAEVNPAMESLLGRPAGDLVGRPVTDFALPGWAARVDEFLAQGRDVGWRGEFPLVRPDDRTVPLEWSLSAHIEPGMLLAIATDVSERVELARQREAMLEREQAARAAAERLNRAKDEFIAVLSHELRTPLNAIVSWVHVLKRPDPAPEVFARGLESIERNAHVQTRLVSDILDMSRMGLGKLRLEFEGVDVAELIRSAVGTLRPAFQEKSITVTLALDGLTSPINADPSRLQQVVWNLLTNAVKFSRRDGSVHIIAQQDASHVTLSVTDHGQGIPPEFLPMLFERFTQGDSASNRRHGGLGLGLSIVKHIVELHGGTVEARSEGEGHGSTFVVTIPADLPARRITDMVGSDVSPQPSVALLDSVRVLVVDDDAEAREMLTMILTERGARVTVASSVADGLAAIEADRPDVLVSDVGMAGQDGYALMRELRRREGDGPRLPAIALTAFARRQDRDMALAVGFDEHLTKPLKAEILVHAIARMSKQGPAA